jgi:DNA-binding protein HU-beta
VALRPAGARARLLDFEMTGACFMNKGQLIDAVAAELGASKVAAGKAIDAVIASITQGVDRDDSVTIAGFGTFSKKDRPARTGRNPSTGEPLEIRASRTVNFKASQSLKDTIS